MSAPERGKQDGPHTTVAPAGSRRPRERRPAGAGAGRWRRLVPLVAGLGLAPPAAAQEAGDAQPPLIEVLRLESGAAVTASGVEVNVRVRDDGAVARVVIDGADVTPPGPGKPSLRAARTVPLDPGPRLIRIEAVDGAGNASFAELAVARTPFLAAGDAAPGAVLEIGGAAGYATIAAILEPLLAAAPRLLARTVNRHRYADRESFVDGVALTVTGKTARLKEPALRLAAAPESIRLEVTTSPFEVTARGRIQYDGPYPTATFQTRARMEPSSVSAGLVLAPEPGGVAVSAAADDFLAALGGVEVEVSAFYDPLDIRGDLVAFLEQRFRSEIEKQLRDVIAGMVRSELVPRLTGGLACMAGRLDLAAASRQVAIDNLFGSLLETADGLTILLDTACAARRAAPSFPPYPGSRAEFAPYPGFPLEVEVSHPVDAALSISLDSLNQLLAAATAAAPLEVWFDLGGVPAPFPMTAGGVARVAGPAFARLEGVDPEEPLGLRIEMRQAPVLRLLDLRVRPGEEEVLESPPALLPEGSEWVLHEGGGVPPSQWAELDFDDSSWVPGESGFAIAAGEAAVPPDVHTLLGFDRPWQGEGLHLRGRVDLKDPGRLVSPLLRVLPWGGLVAYLTGARRAAAPPGGGGARLDAFGSLPPELRTTDIELAPFRHLFVPGTNVVAIEASGGGPSGLVLVPELFDRVPEAVVPMESEETQDGRSTGAGAGSWLSPPLAALELSELEVAFWARRRKQAVDLFALRLRLSLQVCLELTDSQLVLRIDAGRGENDEPLPCAILGGIETGMAYEAIDVNDARWLWIGHRLLPWLDGFLAEALPALELPPFPLPDPVFVGEYGLAHSIGALRTTVVSLDTNGGAPDWITLLRQVPGAGPGE